MSSWFGGDGLTSGVPLYKLWYHFCLQRNGHIARPSKLIVQKTTYACVLPSSGSSKRQHALAIWQRTFRNLCAAWPPEPGTVATKIFWIFLASIQCQQLDTQLYSLCKIVYKLCYFDNGIFTSCTSLSHHATRNLVLNHPFARTNTYLFSTYVYYGKRSL